MNPVITYRTLGVLFWGLVVLVSSRALWQSGALWNVNGDKQNATSLVRYLSGPTQSPVLVDASGTLRVGDPVFFETVPGDWSQIGYVSRTSIGDEATPRVQLAWHTNDLDANQCELAQFYSSGRLDDVVRMLLPTEKRERIQQRLAAAFRTHGDAISSAVVPLVEQSLRESFPLIEMEMRASVSRHRGEVDSVASRLNRDVVQGRLIPLAKEQLLPIVKRHAEEPAEAIGRELWDRASIWRFGWRAVYDSTRIPNKSMVKEEWQRFVDEEATEVVESHMDELTLAVQKILADVASDPDIRSELAQAVEVVASDPQTRTLVQTILKESIVDNQTLRDRWREIWTSEKAVASLSIASDRLEPVVRSIGDEIFGTRDGGIDPDFARVLRNQILGKDRRWIIAKPVTEQSTGDNVIRVSHEAMVFPIVYLAEDENSTGAGQ